MDYALDGKRIRKSLGCQTKEQAESAMADIQAKLQRKEIAKTVGTANQGVTILDRPVVILPLEEYQSLLTQAGRQPDPQVHRVLAKLKSK